MDSLVKCREVWSSVSELPDEIGESGSESGEAQYEDISGSQLDSEVEQELPVVKSRAERHADAAQAASEKRRAERLKRTEADLADLDALIAPSANGKASKSRKVTIRADSDDSDLGEEAPLTEKEAAEKAKRKKSLRFYTSQIAQKANKRGAAGRNAGGDDDIPHRERLRDRQTRLNAEAEKRGKKGAEIGSDLGGDSDDEDRQQAQQIRAHADDDDYYDMVAARTSKKKEDKAALAEAQRQAALQGGQVVQEEVVGTDGKRKINYMIEKNKGLTPHRKKDVRNPRVKKKKKYEEKKKKLASIKPVYKGGEGRGGYGGELTGIKKGLVKSTRL
jgi:U3 small nucleolar RNA-associated protein 3